MYNNSLNLFDFLISLSILICYCYCTLRSPLTLLKLASKLFARFKMVSNLLRLIHHRISVFMSCRFISSLFPYFHELFIYLLMFLF